MVEVVVWVVEDAGVEDKLFKILVRQDSNRIVSCNNYVSRTNGIIIHKV